MLKALILSAFGYLQFHSPVDSLRTEVIDGKTFIIHQVDARETVFSISRRYGVSMLVILEHNPNADAGIEIGQILKVLYVPNTRVKTSDGLVHKVGPKETLYSISRQYAVSVEDIRKWNGLTEDNLSLGQEIVIKNKSLTPLVNSSSKTHTVASKETMFSIARQYGITLRELMEWNNLGSSDLKVGQVLVVSKTIESTVTTVPDLPSTPTTTTPVVQTVAGSDETRETGMARIMEGTEGSRKYLANHRTLTAGSIIKVRNKANNLEVFVRITGTLSSDEESDIVIRVSQAAMNRLGGTEKFSVEIIYFK